MEKSAPEYQHGIICISKSNASVGSSLWNYKAWCCGKCAIRSKQKKVHKRDKKYAGECICWVILCLSELKQKRKATIVMEEIEALGHFPFTLFQTQWY